MIVIFEWCKLQWQVFNGLEGLGREELKDLMTHEGFRTTLCQRGERCFLI